MEQSGQTQQDVQSSDEATCYQLTVDETGLQKVKLILLAILCVILGAFLMAFKVQYFLKEEICAGTTQELESLLLHDNATVMIRTLEANLTDTMRELESMRVLHDQATAMMRTLETNLTEIQMQLARQEHISANLTQELIVALQELQQEQMTNCTDGWEYFDGKCYYFSTDMKNWIDSRDACVTMGGHLVILERPAEMDFIKDKGQAFWIGLTDVEEEHSFHWVDGTFFKNTLPWFRNQPDNWGDEDCVEILKSQTLNDLKCNQQRYRICESRSCKT